MKQNTKLLLLDEEGERTKFNLSCAAKRGHLATVQYLVEDKGEDIQKANIYGWTPLHYVAWRGHFDVAQYLLGKGAQSSKASHIGGWTPLHYAAYHGHLDIAKLLMAHRAPLNARTNAGYLPIDIALTEEIRQAIRDEPRRRSGRDKDQGPTTRNQIPSNTAERVV